MLRAHPSQASAAVPNPPRPEHCQLCARPMPLTFHHLIPRKVHGKPWFRRHFSREEMRGRGLWLCRPCHRAVHRFHDEQALGRQLNTLEALREDPAIARHVAWIAKRRVQKTR